MKKQVFNLRGMMRDLDAAKGSNQYAYEIRNLRLTAQEDSTLLALTTEKGNSQYYIYNEEGDIPYTINGTVVGHCTVGTEYIVLFTHYNSNNKDYIYRLHNDTNVSNTNVMLCTCLYMGDLGFTDSTELETIGIYENENTQKVYWIDGVHQPRVINIVADSTTITHWNNMSICPFDFVLEMNLNETVSITKTTNLYGVFPAGTIQYILCYYTKNGQRTNAFYVSPIYYTSPINKGASPEDAVNNAFSIQVTNIDTNFDYISIYSVLRTSENSTPICRKVADIKIDGAVWPFIDNGLNTETVDYSEILYLGGANIIPYTMEQKNNVLFFGNIKDNSFYININQDLQNYLDGVTIEFTTKTSFSSDIFQLNKNAAEITTFICGEKYRFGIILQNKYGQWSNVLPVGGGYVVCDAQISDNGSNITCTQASLILGNEFKEYLINNLKCVKIKAVRLKDTPQIVCQGVICPTVFSKERKTSVYAQSSWFFRPIKEDMYYGSVYSKHNDNIKTVWGKISGTVYVTGEIISGEYIGTTPSVPDITEENFNDSDFFVDWNLLTFHSPEILYDRVTEGDYIPKVVGYIPFNTSTESEFYTLDTPPHNNINPSSIVPATFNYDKVWDSEYLYSDWYYVFNPFEDSGTAETGWETDYTMMFPVFAWHRDGSLGNQYKKTNDSWDGKLKTKCLASLRKSNIPTYFDVPTALTSHNSGIINMKLYQDDGKAVLLPKDNNNSDYTTTKLYLGEVNTLLNPSGYKLYMNSYLGSSQYLTEGMVSVTNTPIQMKYKSTKHGIIDMGYTSSGNKQILPENVQYSALYDQLFWKQGLAVDNSHHGTLRAVIGLDFEPSAKNWYYVFSKYIATSDSSFHYIQYVLIRKDLVNLFGKINNGEYVTVYGSNTNIIQNVNISLDWKILKKVSFSLADYQELSNYYYQFELITGLRNITFGTGEYIEDSDARTYFYSNSSYSCYLKEKYKRVPSYIREGSTSILFTDYYDYTPFSVTYTNRLYFPSIDIDSLTTNRTPLNKYSVESYIGNIGETRSTYLVNLTRETQNITNFDNTQWIISGTEQSLNIEGTIFNANIGDAYYQRFDCLKTYPYSNEDQNQIVEILSFMVQTRINLDGRYDSQINLADNTIVTNTNFNLLNTGYTQDDNLFSAAYLNPEDYNVDNFPNQLIWTGQKVYGSKLDNWTHVIATSTLDMDGSCGEIKALKLWNDKLLCFQNKGLSVIKYNENAAIATTTGVPIELANSNRVDGKQYISNTIGCQNKNTIQVTHSGLYFADGNTREFYKYGESLESLSKAKGFNTYLYDSSVQFDRLRTFYDPKLKDVYFEIYKQGTTPVTETLIYSEQFGEFTSFMDYDMKYMFPYKDSLISIKDNVLWKQFEGNYLSFYGTSKGYSVELLCSEYPTEDKTFTNFEFRADVFNGNTLINDQSNLSTGNVLPFNKIKAWNEYQTTGDVSLTKTYGGANLSQRFRVWRGDIPRAQNSLDRIRNTWTKLKLWKTSDNNHYKTIIHDVCVSYV